MKFSEIDDELIKKYQRTLKERQFEFGVIGIDIGYSYENADPKQLTVRVHKKQTTRSNSFESFSTGLTPSYSHGRIVKDRRHIKRYPEITPGISIGFLDAGTLGLIVKDNAYNTRCMLTCYHVLQGISDSPVYQPSIAHDNGDFNDLIGNQSRYILDHNGDAALVTLNRTRLSSNKVFNGKDIIINDIREVEIGDTVSKSGRTTSYTEGVVDGIGRYFINYNLLTGSRRVGVDGFRIVTEDITNPGNKEVSAPGDSGAVVFDNDGTGLGMIIAGETSSKKEAEFSIACHLTKVFTQLNVSLI